MIATFGIPITMARGTAQQTEHAIMIVIRGRSMRPIISDTAPLSTIHEEPRYRKSIAIKDTLALVAGQYTQEYTQQFTQHFTYAMGNYFFTVQMSSDTLTWDQLYTGRFRDVLCSLVQHPDDFVVWFNDPSVPYSRVDSDFPDCFRIMHPRGDELRRLYDRIQQYEVLLPMVYGDEPLMFELQFSLNTEEGCLVPIRTVLPLGAVYPAYLKLENCTTPSALDIHCEIIAVIRDELMQATKVEFRSSATVADVESIEGAEAFSFERSRFRSGTELVNHYLDVCAGYQRGCGPSLLRLIRENEHLIPVEYLTTQVGATFDPRMLHGEPELELNLVPLSDAEAFIEPTMR